MSYWERATTLQLDAVVAFCRGKEVLDLGGYDGSLGAFLLERGAGRVHCVDKENPTLSASHPRLTKVMATFGEFLQQNRGRVWQTGIISFPINNDYTMGQLTPLLPLCSEIVYIGKNSGWTQTGTPVLWRYLLTRKLKHSLLERNADILFYNGESRGNQPPSEPELMGLYENHPPPSLREQNGTGKWSPIH